MVCFHIFVFILNVLLIKIETQPGVFSSCSYYIEKKSRRGKTPVSRRSNGGSTSSNGGSGGDLFIVAVAMIAEKLRTAKQSERAGAEELNRYMAVYFDYSTENDVPTVLSLAPR